MVDDTVSSAALKANLLGDPPERIVTVYLPPGYQRNPATRFPVVYLLHGYMGSNKSWTTEFQLSRAMDSLIAGAHIREMIVVMPDGSNKYFGSFYSNSPVTGNWEDFLSRDLIGYVDRKYRTVAQAASRGIAGHSMGGYGAMKLGMKHPDIYGAVYAMSSCCLGWGTDLGKENSAWDRALSFTSLGDMTSAMDSLRKGQLGARWKDGFYGPAFLALAAAWSPNPANPPLFVDFPVTRQNGTRTWVEQVQAEWSANMPLALADQYGQNLTSLRGLAFDVGTQDEFAHTVSGAQALDGVLRQNGVPHVFEEYEGNHMNRIPQRVATKLLPFFSRVLLFDKETPRR